MPAIEFFNLPIPKGDEEVEQEKFDEKITLALTSLKIIGLDKESIKTIFHGNSTMRSNGTKTLILVKIWGQEDTPALSSLQNKANFFKSINQVIRDCYPHNKVQYYFCGHAIGSCGHSLGRWIK